MRMRRGRRLLRKATIGGETRLHQKRSARLRREYSERMRERASNDVARGAREGIAAFAPRDHTLPLLRHLRFCSPASPG